jgi:N-acetylglucosaminyl-diphospho-decaprenol L-rhamnosyltransferase
MRESRRPVTVSIVSHRHWDTVRPLLQQLSMWCAPWIDRVILTLNLPEDVQLDADLEFPVEVLHNARPRGYGANHNTAFTRHATEWFLVMNPDVRLQHDVIGALIARAAADAGLLAPRVQEPGRTEPEPFRTLVTPAELVRRRIRRHVPPAYPSWIAGMFMLFRSAAYRDLRGFDERFYMYCEDVDLCVRLQLAGWKMQVATDTVVLHHANRQSHSSLPALLWHLSSFMKLWTSHTFWEYRRRQKSWQAQSHLPSVLLCAARPTRTAAAPVKEEASV